MIFFRKFINNSRSLGSIAPSSKFLVKEICLLIDELPLAKIVELGAGNGAITSKLINKDNLTIVELDRHFAYILSNKFNIRIENKCAIQYLQEINEECGIVSSIPLINNANFKKKFTKELDSFYHKGYLKWLITYTYGLRDPLRNVGFKTRKKVKTVFLNLPPASIWVYT